MTRKVLQLTAHCEPDGIIDAVHAVVLVHIRKAARVELMDDDETAIVRSVHKVYRVPSIISLVEFHNVRKRRGGSGKLRFRIFIRDGFRCQYCAKKFQRGENLTLDHIVPQSRGGSDAPDNLVTSCNPCNQRKSNRTPDEARMPLLTTPSALRYGLDRAMLLHHAAARPEWRPYLFLEEQVAA